MICPKCNIRLDCQETRQEDKSTRIRQYACESCCGVFYSIEQMDADPGQQEAQKKMKKVWDRRNREKANAKSIHSKQISS